MPNAFAAAEKEGLDGLFASAPAGELLELANPSQPLLRRLLVETPGTYHHSLMVGNLAERAAEAIGADPCHVVIGEARVMSLRLTDAMVVAQESAAVSAAWASAMIPARVRAEA